MHNNNYNWPVGNNIYFFTNGLSLLLLSGAHNIIPELEQTWKKCMTHKYAIINILKNNLHSCSIPLLLSSQQYIFCVNECFRYEKKKNKKINNNIFLEIITLKIVGSCIACNKQKMCKCFLWFCCTRENYLELDKFVYYH